ncbi:MAG: hypothetical protein RDV41_11065 [Planctomycetota bacterium]|nr:hypothetical protein [Planctomycetota bacterium]
MKRTRFWLILCFALMFLLPAASIAPAQDETGTRERILAGSWKVAYEDSILGEVTGVATFAQDEKSVTVRLDDPRYEKEYRLESSEIRCEDGAVVLVLLGESPCASEVKPGASGGTARFPVPEGSDTISASAGDKTVEAGIGCLGDIDKDRVELNLKWTEEGGLEGTWSYRAHPATERDELGRGRVGRFTADPQGRCRPGTQSGKEKWTRPKPVICGALSIDRPRPYPYKKGVTRSTGRLVFVYGIDLPCDRRIKVKLESSDASVEYRLACLGTIGFDEKQHDQLVKEGWAKVQGEMTEAQRNATSDMDGLVIEAGLKEGILPGHKHFTLNGSSVVWLLEFSDVKGRLSFSRRRLDDEFEFTETLFMPETVFIDVVPAFELPYKEIRVALARNGEPVAVLTARPLPERSGVLRTGPIQVNSVGSQQPELPGSAFPLGVKRNDIVQARLLEPELLSIEPEISNASVFKLGSIWKLALARAAACNEKNPDDYEITNNILVYESFKYSIPIILLQRILPSAPRTMESTVSITITVHDHAAMLLVKDELVGMLKAQEQELAQTLELMKQSLEARRMMAANLKSLVQDTDSVFAKIPVTAPDGELELHWVFDESYIKNNFPNAAEADAWTLKKVDEVVARLCKNVGEAAAFAESVQDSDIQELLQLTGFGLEPVLQSLMPKLMREDVTDGPARVRWVPDEHARAAVRTLESAYRAVRAQKEYSDADTAVVSVLLAVPGIMGLFSASAAWFALDMVALAADAAILATDQVPEWLAARADFRFAQNAATVIGTRRLGEAELRESAAFWNMLATAVGCGAGMIEPACKAVAAMRLSRAGAREAGPHLLNKMAKAGIEEMNDVERCQLGLFCSDSCDLRNTLGEAALTAEQRRAADLFDSSGCSEIAHADGAELPRGPRPDRPDQPRAPDQPKTEPEKPPDEPAAPDRPKTEPERPPDEPGRSTEAPADNPEEGTYSFRNRSTEPLTDPATGGTGASGREVAGSGSRTLTPPGAHKPPAQPARPRKQPPRGLPGDGEVWVSPSGERFELDRYLGSGMFAHVYALKNDPNKVIKLYPRVPDMPDHDPARMVQDIMDGAGVLKAEGIPQLDIVRADMSGDTPFVVQRKIPDDWVEGGDLKGKTLSRGQQEAVLDLYRKCGAHDVVWEDGHRSNLAFRQMPGEDRWTAYVLDQDRIGYFTRLSPNSTLSEFRDLMQILPGHYYVHSLIDYARAARIAGTEAAPWPDATFFMEKMLEHKGWIKFEDGAFQGKILDMDDVKKYFPEIESHINDVPPAKAGPEPDAPMFEPGSKLPPVPDRVVDMALVLRLVRQRRAA